ncbi:MAG: hypothetical protein AAFX85_17305, partial [Pseudomonadota bacterium]
HLRNGVFQSMNINTFFKSRFSSMLSEGEQRANEKLIELATFFYKIDRRISLEEQQYIDELLRTTQWESAISIEAYQRECIAKINQTLEASAERVSAYLSNLMQELSDLGAASRAKAIAKEISDADGEIADDEARYLELVMSFE